MCEVCAAKGVYTLAEDVHHIVPIYQDWDNPLDCDDLEALCVSHHNERHGRRRKSVRR